MNTYEVTLADEIAAAYRRAEREACKENEYAALSGEPSNSFDELAAEIAAAREGLAWAASRVEFLRKHAHEWDEDYFCVHCRADGRA